MTVENTIQGMYDHFPTLFKERADCLDHLFCVIGNGMEWKDGELIYTDEDNSLPLNPLKDKKAFQYNKLSLRDEAREYLLRDKKLSEDEIKDIEEYLLTIPDDIYHERPRKERWYFYNADKSHKYYGSSVKKDAFLFNYPDDIKPDWKSAIEECITLLKEDGIL